MMNRREFLLASAAAGVTLSVGSALAGCAGPRRNLDVVSQTHAPLSELGFSPELASMLAYAALAPSGHNTQPWRVLLDGERRLYVEADASRALPQVDPEHRELMLSLGAFIENLAQAAAAYGYRLELESVKQHPLDARLIALQLVPADKLALDLKRITSRRTLRGGYLNDAIEPETLRTLLAAYDGRADFYPRDSKAGVYLAQQALDAFKQQTWRDPAQRELADWIRLDKKSAERLRDGLTTETMEITGFSGWVVRSFMNSDSVMGDGFRKKGVEGVAAQVNQGAGWLAVSSAGQTPADLIECGRRFERMALQLREHGVAAHPMSQMLEESPFRSQIAGELGVNDPLQFVLRIGKVARYPEPVSLRREVKRFAEAV